MVTAYLISRLSHAVDLIEKRSQQNRPCNVVMVRRHKPYTQDAADHDHEWNTFAC